MWSRITSVSRRGFTRIYEFLTGSRDRKAASECRETASDSRHFSPPPPPGGGGCAGPRAHPPSEPPQGGWHCLLPLLAAGVSPYLPCACYFSNTAWIISQAMACPPGGGEHVPPGSLLMACQTMQTGPLLPPLLCIHWLKCGLNLYGTRRFYPPGTRRFYRVHVCTAWLSTDRRIAFSSLKLYRSYTEQQ